MIVAGLLALAMIASLLLVISDSVQVLRIAVVVALWAATVGAIAMTKYRRESALDRAKVEDLKTVYDLQLEREISARREYELTVEERVRSDLRIDAEEMAALRRDLAALRHNLEVLFDGRLPDDNVALDGQTERRRELDATTRVTAPRPSGPAFASPDDEPLTAETTTVSPEEHIDTRGARAAETGPSRPRPSEPRTFGPPPERGAPETPAAEGSAADSRPTDVPTAEPPTGRRGRRRAEGAHSEGRSVAEILAALSSER
ncbi:Uncharacterised protein [Rhodococcus coprophilus]|uniref:DUF6779 domain-containing protein n=2 Tax=Rhodococcus coprophilus TaxID=38310 RepID=A0A2X4WZM8_9NOCA|nr:Uncharacterised protein [Rhodococcus coprophilus]